MIPLMIPLDDFKPLSVDLTKPGKLRVAEDEVNVQLPVGQVRVVIQYHTRSGRGRELLVAMQPIFILFIHLLWVTLLRIAGNFRSV